MKIIEYHPHKQDMYIIRNKQTMFYIILRLEPTRISFILNVCDDYLMLQLSEDKCAGYIIAPKFAFGRVDSRSLYTIWNLGVRLFVDLLKCKPTFRPKRISLLAQNCNFGIFFPWANIGSREICNATWWSVFTSMFPALDCGSIFQRWITTTKWEDAEAECDSNG